MSVAEKNDSVVWYVNINIPYHITHMSVAEKNDSVVLRDVPEHLTAKAKHTEMESSKQKEANIFYEHVLKHLEKKTPIRVPFDGSWVALPHPTQTSIDAVTAKLVKAGYKVSVTINPDYDPDMYIGYRFMNVDINTT